MGVSHPVLCGAYPRIVKADRPDVFRWQQGQDVCSCDEGPEIQVPSLNASFALRHRSHSAAVAVDRHELVGMAPAENLDDLSDDVLHELLQHVLELDDRKKTAIALACTSRRMNDIGRVYLFRRIHISDYYGTPFMLWRVDSLKSIPGFLTNLR